MCVNNMYIYNEDNKMNCLDVMNKCDENKRNKKTKHVNYCNIVVREKREELNFWFSKYNKRKIIIR